MAKLIARHEFIPSTGLWDGEMYAHCLLDENGDFLGITERLDHRGSAIPKLYASYESALNGWKKLGRGERAIVGIFRMQVMERVDDFERTGITIENDTNTKDTK